jgi:hypothetical protein
VLSRRRSPRDPRELLARLVERLGRRSQYVTFADVERAVARSSASLRAESLAELVEAAVAESLLLKDLRTFYDRRTGGFSEQWVYRVNPRHPLVRELLDQL